MLKIKLKKNTVRIMDFRGKRKYEKVRCVCDADDPYYAVSLKVGTKYIMTATARKASFALEYICKIALADNMKIQNYKQIKEKVDAL